MSSSGPPHMIPRMLRELLQRPLPLETILDIGRGLIDEVEALGGRGALPIDSGMVFVEGEGAGATIRIGSPADSLAADTNDRSVSTDGHAQDERAAVLQVGALLFEMLAGARPEGTSTPGGLGWVLPSLTTSRPDLPPELACAIYRMLDPDPDLRMQSLSEARQVILALRGHDEPVRTEMSWPQEPPPGLPGAPPLLWSTPFIGRHEEMRRAHELLAESPCRLLTILGPGGIGKSRLAFEAAQRLSRHFPDGVHIVPLGGVIIPEFVTLAIGSALGLSFFGSREPVQQLVSLLDAKSTLVILDDFDRVLEGADLIARILVQTRGPRFMVTSRSRLNLHGETLLSLLGLELPPDPSTPDAGDYDAVRLFREHARLLGEHESVGDAELPDVVRICQLLDGVPLGIEHAARWVRALPCAEIAREISRDISLLATDERNVADHHRSMHAVFERSWRTLPEPLRILLARTSVFRGGFRRDAVEQIAGMDLPALAALVDRSLVQRSAPLRYQVHQVLRAFLAGKLATYEGEPARTMERFASWYLELLEGADHGVRGGDPEALASLDAELDNLYAAWEWALHATALSTADRMLEPLSSFLTLRAWHQAGEKICRDAVRALDGLEGSNAKDRLLARILARHGAFTYRLGDRPATRALLERSRALQVKVGAREHLPFTLRHLALVANSQGASEEARALYEEALALCGEYKDRRMEAYVLGDLGIMAQEAGDYAAAKDLHARSLALHREEGNAAGVISTLNCLGTVCRSMGELEPAGAFFQESLAASSRAGNRRGQMVAIMNLCNLHQDRGENEDALARVNEALAIARELGQQDMLATCLCTLGNAYLTMGRADEAVKALEESLGIRSELGATREAAVSRVCLADALCLRGEFARACDLYQESLQVFEREHIRWGIVSAWCGLCNARLGQGDIAEATAAGRTAVAALRGSGDRRSCGQVLGAWVRILIARGCHRRAATLWGSLDAHILAGNLAVSQAGAALEDLRRALPAEELESTLTAGRLVAPEILLDQLAAAEGVT